MKNIKDVYQRINSIDFKIVPDHSTNEYHVSVKDKFTSKVIEDGFNIVFIRTLSFEPAGLYNLSVEAEVSFKLEDSENGVDFDVDYINENVADLLANNSTAVEFVSQLITNISSTMGRSPIVTPPRFISDQES